MAMKSGHVVNEVTDITNAQRRTDSASIVRLTAVETRSTNVQRYNSPLRRSLSLLSR
jgi:hypothetical protein